MDTSIIEIAPRGLALVPVTVGLVGLARLYFSKSFGSYIAPLLSFVIGMGLAFLIGGIEALDSRVLGGILVGLMASGLYSGAKTLAGY